MAIYPLANKEINKSRTGTFSVVDFDAHVKAMRLQTCMYCVYDQPTILQKQY